MTVKKIRPEEREKGFVSILEGILIRQRVDLIAIHSHLIGFQLGCQVFHPSLAPGQFDDEWSGAPAMI
jgi:hypothetical protein